MDTNFRGAKLFWFALSCLWIEKLSIFERKSGSIFIINSAIVFAGIRIISWPYVTLFILVFNNVGIEQNFDLGAGQIESILIFGDNFLGERERNEKKYKDEGEAL